jgi:RNA polymerase sigma-70 factor (ECF subfamily)
MPSLAKKPHPEPIRQLDLAERPTPADGITPESLYETHFDRVWRNLRRLGVEEAALEDAAQDVFITVFRRWDTWDEGRSSVDTWIFGILRKVASRYRRGTKRRLARFFPWGGVEVDEAPSARDTPSDSVEKKPAEALLERLLARVSPSKRELLILVDVEQLSVVEAADALEINLNTAYSRLRAARAEFSESLERYRAKERRTSRVGGHS